MTLQYNSPRSNSVYCQPCQKITSGAWKPSCRYKILFENCQKFWNQILFSKTGKHGFKQPPGLAEKPIGFTVLSPT